MEKLMKKKILIISNPGDERAGNYCEGVHKDVENFFNFLHPRLEETGIIRKLNGWKSLIKLLFAENWQI